MSQFRRAIAIFVLGGVLGTGFGVALGFFIFPYVFPPPAAAEQLSDAERARLVASGTFIHANPADPVHYGRGRVSVFERAVFLEPPDDPAHWARWNSSCIMCHSVAGQPRHDLASDRFESRAAELGIACEACHGPGAQHVEKQRDPVARFATRRAAAGDPSIVNPARLDARHASEVCGQCHSYFVPRDAERWWQTGFSELYRPGGAKLPLSRRPRERLELAADGTARVFVPGPDDRSIEQAARWHDEDGAIVIRAGEGGAVLTIVERAADRLVVRRARPRAAARKE